MRSAECSAGALRHYIRYRGTGTLSRGNVKLNETNAFPRKPDCRKAIGRRFLCECTRCEGPEFAIEVFRLEVERQVGPAEHAELAVRS